VGLETAAGDVLGATVLGFVALLGFLLLGVLYFLPSVIALARHHHNAPVVVVLNLLLGWSFVGWVVSLALALTATPPYAPNYPSPPPPLARHKICGAPAPQATSREGDTSPPDQRGMYA